MGTLRQNRKDVLTEIKGAKLEKEHVSVYAERLMIMKWIDKKEVCFIRNIHDDKLVPTRIRGSNMGRTKTVTDYGSVRRDVELSDKLSQQKEKNH
jgi:hypothetical protein